MTITHLLVAVALLISVAGAQNSPNAQVSCQADSRYAQFDFWVGEWAVYDASKEVASSSITREASGCLIVESYRQADGYSGKSLNFIDAATGKWRQVWADSGGAMSQFEGEWRDGAIRYEGETHRPGGTLVKRKMVLTPLKDGRVFQHSEASTDDGKTWRVNYELTYVRK